VVVGDGNVVVIPVDRGLSDDLEISLLLECGGVS
jgi:hypothetical protein